jgi:hypothetical protein
LWSHFARDQTNFSRFAYDTAPSNNGQEGALIAADEAGLAGDVHHRTAPDMAAAAAGAELT